MGKYNNILILRKIIRFMEDNLKEDISVDDIARESAYSLSHFTRLFMELTGETPGAYLRKRQQRERSSGFIIFSK